MRNIKVVKKIEMDIQLFEDIYHFLSAMKLCPEVWENMNIEKHKLIMRSIEPVYDEINQLKTPTNDTK